MDKGKIIEDIHPLIITCINKYAKSKGEFEDLYSEGVVCALESMDKYDESKGVTVYAYLRSVLTYFYLGYARGCKPVQSLNITIGDSEVTMQELLFDDTVNIEEDLLVKEKIEQIRSAIETLTDEERDFIHKIYFKKKTFRDLAEESGVSSTSIYRKNRSLLKKLRGLLE